MSAVTLRGWGELLRERREALGFSQADLAGVVGCSQSSISRWEQGEVWPTWYWWILMDLLQLPYPPPKPELRRRYP